MLLRPLEERAVVVGKSIVVIVNGMRYRGRVECVVNSEPNGNRKQCITPEAMVCLVDTGARVWRRPSQLFEFTDLCTAQELFCIPSYVMEARLSKIKPTVANHSVWVPGSIKWFKEIMTANSNRFRMKVTHWVTPQQVRNYI
jgi:hypothetical protein